MVSVDVDVQISRISSEDSPIIAAMVPGFVFPAICIFSARNFTKDNPFSKEKDPEIVQAEYSPRLCPATIFGS